MAALFAVTCITVAGCGDDDDSSDSGASSNGAFPVSVEHKYGTTEIKQEPKRVVTVGVTDQDPVLALGVTPVAVVNWRQSPFFEWNQDKVGEPAPAELEYTESVNIEAVAAQQPDLILALWSGLTQDEYNKLSQIAPTVGPDGRYDMFGTPWQETTRVAGKALGKSDQAELLVSDVEQQLGGLKSQHTDLAGKKVLIAADFGDGQIYPTPPSDTRYGALTALGMDPNVPGLEGVEALSLEEAGKLNAADVVIWITLADATIQNNPVYTALPVHQQGRDIFVSGTTGLALTFSSVLSIPYSAEKLVPALTAAVDGDPATAVPAA